MKAKMYRISIGTVGPWDCRAASPRKAIEAHVVNPDEVSIIWYTNWTGGLYRVGYYDGSGPGAAFIGKIAVVKEESA